MLKILKRTMVKLLVGAMFISLIPTQIVLAADVTTQTTNVGLNTNSGDITTGAAVSFNSGDTTTGPAVNINEGDVTAPVFSSTSIDKKSATTGDILTVTVEASDDMSGIDSISISYDAPAGSASKYVSLRKSSESKYVGTITVEPNDAIGLWKVKIISIYDNASNKVSVFNTEFTPSVSIDNAIAKDLSAGDFDVNSTVLDPIVTPIPTPTPDEPTKEIEMPTSIRVSGTERVGSKLIAELFKNDSKFIPTYDGKVVYEWYRLDNEYSKTGSLIGRSKYYYLSSSDLDKYMKLVVYYNNKKINEHITSKITKRESSSNSDSSSGSSSS